MRKSFTARCYTPHRSRSTDFMLYNRGYHLPRTIYSYCLQLTYICLFEIVYMLYKRGSLYIIALFLIILIHNIQSVTLRLFFESGYFPHYTYPPYYGNRLCGRIHCFKDNGESRQKKEIKVQKVLLLTTFMKKVIL